MTINKITKSSRDIYPDTLLSIDTLHNAYHQIASKLSKKSTCKLHLIDDIILEKLSYLSFERDKIDLFIQALLEIDCYFSIKFSNKKEIYYHKDIFEENTIDYTEVNTIKIYKRVYTSEKFLIFGAKVSLVVDFWRKENDIYISNRYTPIATEIAEEFIKTSFTTIIINKKKVSILSESNNVRKKILLDPIDIVYTWVNSADLKWQGKKEKRLAHQEITCSTSNDNARYANNTELLYSLRSVLTYFKGINNIYIVTDDQTPDFLNLNNTKIKIIDHTDIFTDKSHLPTYNSHAIESQLHHIKELSNKYLYFNDDIFLGRVVTRNLFFDEYDKAKCFYSNAVVIPPTEHHINYSPVNNAAINNRKLLETKYGIKVNKKFKHTPVATLKNVIEKMEIEFPDIFTSTGSHPIRNSEDYAIAGALYYHYGMFQGKVYPSSSIAYTYIAMGMPKFKSSMQKISANKESERYDIICVNSLIETDSYNIDARYFNQKMLELFPLKSEYEN